MIENTTKKQDNEAFHEPSRQYFNPAQIVHNFSQKGRDHLNRKTSSQFILSLQAGAFMAFGAAFSILLSMGIDIKGVSHLMAGIGFATGYAMVFLSGAILFTEVNVLLPSYLFQKPSLMSLKIIKFLASDLPR
ncbi:formate/nitrite transporter family protein [Metabacillus sp. B2-18]|uniref:formate/nitrite transporter family protein n=1 Tax=Metabacillus sp. B2-18 TaxID=2897333 RepID=UPI0022ABE2F5|nr:formate/nitrite transporter family protein [Metabacillus sp. B2-18]